MELMKSIFSPVEVARLMERLSPDDGPLNQDLALRYLRVLLMYIFKRSDFGVQQALTLKLHPTTRELTMTMEEQILLRGEQLGLKKGLEQGIEQGIEQGLEKGIEQGLRRKALEDAQKMREHDIDWGIVTDVTGIKPEDLQ